MRVSRTIDTPPPTPLPRASRCPGGGLAAKPLTVEDGALVNKRNLASRREIIEEFSRASGLAEQLVMPDDDDHASLSQDERAARLAEQRALSRYFDLHALQKDVRNISFSDRKDIYKHDVFQCRCGVNPKYQRKNEDKEKDLNVEIHKYENYHSYVNLRKCASTMVCPVCGPRIKAEYGEMLKNAAETLIQRDYSFLFVTFTASHSLNTDFKQFVKDFSSSLKFFKAGREYKEIKKEYGIVHSVTTTEVTDDCPLSSNERKKTGFHFHKHALIFTDKLLSEEQARELEIRLKEKWVKSTAKYNLKATLENGLTLEIPYTKNNGYIETKEQLKKLSEYITKTFQYEMTASNNKSKNGRISINELLHLYAITKEEKYLHRYLIYMKGMKGICFIKTTKGFWKDVEIEEKTEEEMLEGESAEQVFVFDDVNNPFFLVAKHGQQKKLLLAADRKGVKAIEDAMYYLKKDINPWTGEQLE